MPTDTPVKGSENPSTPFRTGVKLHEMTSSELKNALRAASFLLSEQMEGHIADKLLVAKLGSLHGDLLIEEEDRAKLNGH